MRKTRVSDCRQGKLQNTHMLQAALAAAVGGCFAQFAHATDQYNPMNGANDLWSAGTNWTAGKPVAPEDLTFGGAEGSTGGGSQQTFTNGFTDTNTDDLSGNFGAYSLYFEGAGPASGTAANININAASGDTIGAVYNITCDATGAAFNYNINAPLVLSTASTVNFGGNGTANFNFYGVVSGDQNANFSGSSTKTFYGTNTFGGGGGTILMTSGLAKVGYVSPTNYGQLFGTSSVVKFVGGSIDLDGGSQIIQTIDSGPNTSNAASSLIYNSNVGTTSTFTITNADYAPVLAKFENNTGTGGTLALTYSGGNTLTLSAAEAYTGVTTISGGGTIQMSGGTLATGAPLTITSGTFNIGTTTEVLGAVANSGTITSNGSTGGVTIGSGSSGSGTYTGTTPVYISNGTLGSAITGSFNNVGTLSNIGTGVGATALSGVIGTNVTSVIENSATSALALSGANTYTSNTTLTAGTLDVNGSQALGASAATLTINGGTLDNTSGASVTLANNNPQTWGSNFAFTGTNNLNLGTGAVSLGTAAGTSRTVTVNGGVLTVGGVISNGTTATGLSVAGAKAGTLALTGISTYTGATTITGGQLQLAGAGSINTTSGITINGTAAAFVTNSSTAVSRAITLTSGSIGGSGTLSSALTVPSAAHLAPGYGLTGTSTANLTIANTLAINAGAVLDYRLSTATTGSNDLVTVSGNNNVTVGNGGTLNITATGGTLAVGNYVLISDPTGTINGGTAPTGYSFTSTGASRSYVLIEPDAHHLDLQVSTYSVPSLTWNGNTNSNFSTNAADVNFYNGSANTYFVNASPVLFQDVKGGGSTNVTNNNISVTTSVAPASLTFNNSAVAYTLNSTDSGHLGITGSTGISLTGPGKVTLTGTNTYTGTLALSAGTLNATTASIDGSSTTSGITFNGGTLQAGGTISTAKAVSLTGAGTIDVNGNSVALSGVVSGSGLLTVSSTAGGGTLTLTAANTYNGGSQVNTGATLATGLSANTTTLGSGTVTLAGGKLALQGQQSSSVTLATQSYNNNLVVSGNSGIDVSGSLAATMGTLSIGSNALSVTSVDTTTSPYSLTLGATTLIGNASFNVANSTGGGAGTLNLGALNDGGTARTITFNPTGASNVTLASNATSLVSGTMVNVSNGTLNSNSASALGTFATVNVASPATLSLGATQQVSGLTGSGAVSLSTNNLTIGNTDNLSSAFSGAINGAGTVSINTTGTVTLSGSSTYSGTVINSNGSRIQTSVEVKQNANLAVNGASNLTGGAINSSPLGTGAVLLNANSSLLLGPTAGLTVANPIYGASNGSTPSIIGGSNTTGINTYSGNVTLGTGTSGDNSHNAIVGATAGGEVDFTGNILANSTAGYLSAVTVNNLTGSGSATVKFTGSNTYNGGTTINPNVTLAVGPSMSTTTLGTGTVTLAGGKLALQGVLNTPTQQQIPLTAASFNADTILDAAAPTGVQSSTGVQTSALGPGLVYFQNGYQGNTTNGLPTTGVVTSTAAGGHTFQLAPYTGLNTVQFAAGDTNTLTLATRGQYQTLDFLGTGPGGPSTFTVTLNFSDSTSDTASGFTIANWYNGGNALRGLDPAQQDNSGTPSTTIFDYGGNLTLDEEDVTVPVADQGKTITSVTLNATSVGNNGDIYALAGFTSASAIPLSTQSYAGNNFTVTANSTIDVSGSLAATIGTLNIGSSALSVTSADTTASPYTLTAGAVTFASTAPTFNVSNSSGGGVGTLILGALNDQGAKQTLTKTGSGVLTLNTNATNFGTGGATINIAGGTLNSNASTAIGATAAVNLSPSTTFGVGATQTVASVNDTSSTTSVILSNDAVLTIGTVTDANSSISGVISDGTADTGAGGIFKGGAGTLTLSGANTYSGTTTVSFGTLVAANTTGSATGTGDVTINQGTLASGTIGTIAGNVIAGTNYHIIAPGGVGSIGVFNVGGLETNYHTTINFDLGTGTGEVTNGDLLTLGSGTVAIANGTVITFGTNPTTAGADYRLIGGSISGITLSNFTLPTPPTGDAYTLSTSVDPGYIDLVVTTSGPNNLIWNNSLSTTGDGITWENGSDPAGQNFENGSSPSGFTTGDNVTFNDNNNGHYTVNIAANVLPTSVTVNSSGSYNIGSTGGFAIGDVPAGTTTLSQSGGGLLTISNSNTFTGATAISGIGTTLHLTSTGALASATLTVGTGSIANIDGNLTGNPAITANGNLTFGAANSSNNPAASTLLRSASSLTVGSGATVKLATSTSHTLLTALSVSSLSNTGTIDLTNNDMIVRAAAGLTEAQITTQVAAAYNGGTWTGSSSSGVIGSSAAASDSKHLTAVGIDTGLTSFDGLTVAAGDILVKYTYYGDTNLDGAVDGSDYTNIDNGFHNHLTGWQNGDFNYDNKIDGSDYTLIDNAFNTQSTTLGTNPLALIASNTSQIAGGTSAVPEPTTLGLLGIGAAGLLARRRRRN